MRLQPQALLGLLVTYTMTKILKQWPVELEVTQVIRAATRMKIN